VVSGDQCHILTNMLRFCHKTNNSQRFCGMMFISSTKPCIEGDEKTKDKEEDNFSLRQNNKKKLKKNDGDMVGFEIHHIQD
jgi:hypothetical protein